MREEPEDYLMCVTEMHFSWLDRLRIFFGWKVEHYSRTACEKAPGWTHCEESRVIISRPSYLPQHKRGGYGSVA